MFFPESKIPWLIRVVLMVAVALACCQCATTPYRPRPLPPKVLAAHFHNRAALAVQLPSQIALKLVSTGRSGGGHQVMASTATPIAPDGFYLTAAHGLPLIPGPQEVVVTYRQGRVPRRALARVLWRDPVQDIALLRIARRTPFHYEWTPEAYSLPQGVSVTHGGQTTGPSGAVGHLVAGVNGHGSRGAPDVVHTLRLKPGDSGGPLVTLSGELIAINSSIRLHKVGDTLAFNTAWSVRPHLAKLRALMDADRKRFPLAE